MTRYENTLNKIAPTFYKLLQYGDYFYKSYELILSYLKQEKFFETYNYSLSTTNIYYYYINVNTYFEPLWKKTSSERLIMLTTKYKKPKKYQDIYFDEFVVNMVINNFSFENNEYTLEKNFTVVGYYKKVFIALVGKDMYETIRNNIK